MKHPSQLKSIGAIMVTTAVVGATLSACTVSPTHQSVIVVIKNDTLRTVVVDQCEDGACSRFRADGQSVLRPGEEIRASTSDRSVPNPRRVADIRTGKVLGCLPLLINDRPATTLTIQVSSAGPCGP